MISRIACSLTILASLLSADTLLLRDGSSVDGSYVGGDSRTIRMAVNDEVKTYPIDNVQSLTFGKSASGHSASAEPSSSSASTKAAESSSSAAVPAASSSTASPSATVEVPSGTQIVIRMIDAVDSESDKLGQTFRASIDEPVIINGQTVIPRDAEVTARLANEKQSGKLAGKTELTLDLQSVQVNGRPVELVTTGVSHTSGSRGERTAKVVGGAAALGALIGGIAGGGKGAAIGAGSGAAAGTAVQVITSGQRVRIPSETRLTFTLQQSARI